jgi:hypothetical protein
MTREHINCPVCGRLGDSARFERAGTHSLGLKRVLRGLGRGKGFEWGRLTLRLEVLQALEGALERALAQVRQLAGATAWCPQCREVLGVRDGRVVCDRCWLVF